MRRQKFGYSPTDKFAIESILRAIADCSGRIIFVLFSLVATTEAALFLSNAQLRFKFGRLAAFLLFPCLTFVMACLSNNQATFLTAAIVFAVMHLTLMFGMRFPNRQSRIVGFVSFEEVNVHLLRVNGLGELRRLKSDLTTLIAESIDAGAKTLILSSPIFCRKRAPERIAKLVEITLDKKSSVSAWTKVESSPFWLGALASWNFSLMYGDTLIDVSALETKPYQVFNRIPTGIKLIQSKTIRYSVKMVEG